MLPPRLAGGPPGDRARLQALARAAGVTGRSGPYPVAAAVLRARGYTVGVMPEGPDRYPAARCRCVRPRFSCSASHQASAWWWAANGSG